MTIRTVYRPVIPARRFHLEKGAFVLRVLCRFAPGRKLLFGLVNLLTKSGVFLLQLRYELVNLLQLLLSKSEALSKSRDSLDFSDR